MAIRLSRARAAPGGPSDSSPRRHRRPVAGANPQGRYHVPGLAVATLDLDGAHVHSAPARGAGVHDAHGGTAQARRIDRAHAVGDGAAPNPLGPFEHAGASAGRARRR